MTVVIIAIVLMFGLPAYRLFRRWIDIRPPERIALIACCCILGIRPLLGSAVFPAHGNFFALTIILLSIGVLILKVSARRQPPIVGRGDIFFLGFLACSAVSVLVSVNRSASIEQLSAFIALFAWFWVLRNVPNGLRLHTVLIRVLVLTFAAVLVYALYQYFFGFRAMREFALQHPEHVVNLPGFWRRLTANAVFGPFLYPPALGGYLVMLLPMIAGMLANSFPASRQTRLSAAGAWTWLWYAALLAAGIVVLVLTRSKGAWLCAGMASALLLIFLPRRWQWGLGGMGTILTLGTVFMVKLNRTLTLPGWDNFVASFLVRAEYANAAFSMISRRPFLGFGSGTFGTVYPLFKTRLGEETIMAHNSFLQIWAESGLFSLLFFLMFWGTLLRCSWVAVRKKTNRQGFIAAGVFAGLCGFLAHNLVDFDLYQGQLSLVAFTLAAILVEFSRRTDQGITWNQPFRRKFPLPFFLIVCTLSALAATLTLALAADYYDGRAAAFFQQRDFERSLQAGGHAIRLYPLPARFHYHQGLTWEAAAQSSGTDTAWSAAIAAYQEAARREPYTAAFHHRLGLLLLRHRDPAYRRQSIQAFEKAAACYPLQPLYREELAAAYAANGEEKKAVAAKQLAEELKKYYIRGTR